MRFSYNQIAGQSVERLAVLSDGIGVRAARAEAASRLSKSLMRSVGGGQKEMNGEELPWFFGAFALARAEARLSI